MLYYKGCKIRLYPTKEQEKSFWNHIHTCRFVWNYMVAKQRERYANGESYWSHFDMNNHITEIKQLPEYAWLYEVSNTSLFNTCRLVDRAYQRQFKHLNRRPKFKSRKKATPTFSIDKDKTWFDEKGYVHIIKVGKVKYKTDLNIPQGSKNRPKICNCQVTYCVATGKWLLTFEMYVEKQDDVSSDNIGSVGIDLGIKNLAIISYNGKQIVFGNINKSAKVKKLERRYKYLQKSVARKYRQNRQGWIKSNNILKQEQEMRKIANRISNIRYNYIHQTTSFIINLRPEKIVIEDLNVIGLMSNSHLAKSVRDQCFHEFARQIEYKSNWNGIRCVKADRFYPSSKTCSCCGNIKKDLKLKDRIYECAICGLVIDRDFNAALNLERYEV